MKVWGLSEAQIRQAAREANLAVWNDWAGRGLHMDGKAIHVRLCVNRHAARDNEGLLPFQKVGHGGRKLPYVTWEGHREFMRICFRMNGEARIKSAVADYRGREDFWETHPSTRGMWSTPRY